MPADYHMHLIHDTHEDKCPYTLERIAAYLQVAEKNGVQEIGITEHCHRFTAFRPVMAHLLEGDNTYDAVTEWLSKQFYEPLDEYVEVLVKAQQRGWPVKIGLEVDYIPGQEDAIREILAPYPWDYTLGSVHYIDTWGIDISPQSGWPDRDIDEAYRTYFQLLQQAAKAAFLTAWLTPTSSRSLATALRMIWNPFTRKLLPSLQKRGARLKSARRGFIDLWRKRIQTKPC